MNRWFILLAAPALLLPVIAIIAFSMLGGSGEQEPATRSTPRELPEFAYYSSKAETGYRLAIDHQPLFSQMPCYCGCGAMPQDPHRSLLDCFMNDDGSFDSHASGCDICNDIAVDVVQWQAEGKGLAETRSLVDAKYRRFGPSTTAGAALD